MTAIRRYDAILFDFDGVLADTEPVHCACWAEAVRPFGIDLDWETYQGIGIGASDRDLAEFMARRAGPPMTAERLLTLHPEKRRFFEQRMLSDPPISRSTQEYLKQLADYKLAVVTSSFKSEIEPVLERANIRALFRAIVAGDEVPRVKPAPDPYLLAAKLLHAKSPLVVEDSDAGVASARAAGFDVLRLRSPAELPEKLAAALNR